MPAIDRRWPVVAPAAAAAALAFDAAGAPTPALLGPLLIGIVAALRTRDPLAVPRRLVRGAYVVVGVSAGVSIGGPALADLAAEWPAILLLCASGLVVSLLLGLALERLTSLDRPTALLGMLSGGAPAMIATASSLGADVRIVAVVQYLRLLMVVTATPLAVDLLFAPDHTAAAGGAAVDWEETALLVAGCALAAALVRPLGVPGGTVVVATLVAAAASATGLLADVTLPPLLIQVALGVMGVQVGLRFTPRSLRQAGAVTPVAVALVAVMIAACGLVGVLLAEIAGVSQLEGYLASTPGGLSAVIALTLVTDVDSSFAVPVQVVRMLFLVVTGPIAIRWLVLRGGARGRP